MKDVPVSFEYEGIQFDCYFSQVSGSGGTGFYHLYTNNNYYLGQLWKTDNYGWQFAITK